MVEQALVIVEAEQERADFLLLLGVAEAADHAIGGALLLDLDHRPLARAIFEVHPLGDHAVERSAAAFSHPIAMSRSSVTGDRCSPRRWFALKNCSSAARRFDERLLGQRSCRQAQAGRTASARPDVSGGELAHAALGRMKPHLERLERQRIADRDDQFAIEQEFAVLEARRASRRLRENSGRAACPTWTSA